MRYLFIITLFLLGCSRTPDQIRIDTDRLLTREKSIRQELKGLEYQKSTLQESVDSLKVLKEEVRALEYQKNGGEVEYILTVTLSQDRGTFSGATMKDFLNAVDFQIIVDRKTYNHYKPGMEYFRGARHGSALTEGSHSDWLITVKEKKINYL